MAPIEHDRSRREQSEVIAGERRKKVPTSPAAACFSPRRSIGTPVAFIPAIMDIESALETEVSRLMVVADAAAREIAANRPWWVAAVAFLKKVAL